MKNIKKFLALAIVAAMTVGLVACGSQAAEAPAEEPAEEAAEEEAEEPEAEEAEAEEPAAEEEAAEEPAEEPAGDILIGYTYPTANNEFWGNALTYINQVADTLGFKIQADDCNNDQAEQIQDVDAMISAGIQGLVLAPQDASVVPGILDTCKSNNIPVVIVDRWPGDELVAGEDYIAFLGPDDETAGYEQAKSLIEGGCKKLVGLGGFQGTSVAEGRKAGLDKALAEYPDVELLQFEYVGENTDDGDAGMRNLLSAHEDLDGVWCYNDSLALASVNVLKEAGLIPGVKVGGMDLLSPAVDSMSAGELWFSTGGHYYQSAFAALILYDTLMGYEYDGDPVVKISLLAVSQDNLDEFKAKYGSGEGVDWTTMTKTQNPDAEYVFNLSL